ncbi:MAG TPA: hypothetical protein VGF85_00430 [Opitutaceae bacterium]|jgi:hypothetical protein
MNVCLLSPKSFAALAAIFVATSGLSYSEEFEAVESKTAKDYIRKTDATGAYIPETYVFGQGDDWRGARVDSTIDDLSFMDVARALTRSLVKKAAFCPHLIDWVKFSESLYYAPQNIM